MQRRWFVLVLLLVVGFASGAESADHVLSGASLTLIRTASGKQKLTFIAKDPAFLFPAIGSPDDPSTVGATLALASNALPTGIGFLVPPGTGKPGWRAKDATLDSYRYVDPAAAPGPRPVKTIILKQGSVLKITGRGVGLPLAGPQGTVGIRLRIGSQQNCALFDAATIRRDEAGRFQASGSVGTSLTDCSSLLPPPPTSTTMTPTTTTTTTSFVLSVCSGGEAAPTCGGSCPAGETCGYTVDFTVDGIIECLCYPPEITPCDPGDYPTCGGQCPNGGACQAFFFDGGTPICGCVDATEACFGLGACQPGRCAPGLVCRVSGGTTFCGCQTPP